MIKEYDWTMVFFLSLIPILGLIGVPIYTYYNGLVWQEPVMMLIGWWIAGMGITFGYHRLYAHRSFQAHPVIQFLAMLCGTAALQNSILKWSSDHRIHHNKLDTDADPYSIKNGFFYAHMGWILDKKSLPIQGVHDLKKNPIVQFQYKYYWPLAIFLSFIFPMVIGSLYGRPLGGLLWGGFLRMTFVHHFTFFINSLCHYAGKRPFEPFSTARDSWWVAFFTFGEGFHNFHHKFQWDYRNGIRWYDFDPGKWSIKFLSFFGLTSNIRKVEDYKILNAKMLGLKTKIKSHYLSIPENIKSQLEEINNQAKEIYDSWHELEQKYKLMKDAKIDRIQNRIIKQKRKLFKKEYIEALKTLSIILFSIQNANFKV